jgi:hypothetical protein
MEEAEAEAVQALLALSARCCQLCSATVTPIWRRSAVYEQLCNRCGVRERKKERAAGYPPLLPLTNKKLVPLVR